MSDWGFKGIALAFVFRNRLKKDKGRNRKARKEDVFISYRCCNTLSPIQWLKTTYVYYFTYDGQSDGGQSPKIKVWTGLCSYWRRQREIYFLDLSSFWKPPASLGSWLLPASLKSPSVLSLTASSSLSSSDICFHCRISFSDSDPPLSRIRPPTQSRIISLPQHL